MKALRVALLQMTACGSDQAANQAKGESFCRKAKAMGADVALFPEMWNIGYCPYEGRGRVARRKWREQAIARDSAYVKRFRALANELEMAIALTYLERGKTAPRNTVSIIDRRGKLALTYAKVHTCDFLPLENACEPGEDFHVCTLDTAAGRVRVGAMICYDREFPESARILMLKGAEVILTPNACALEPARLMQFRTRAFENMVGVAMANYAAPQHNGHSVAYDGVQSGVKGEAFDPLLVEAGPSEGVYMAEFDIARLRAYRAREIWGDAFRRPHRYHLLTSLAVRKPFHRRDAQGKKFARAKR